MNLNASMRATAAPGKYGPLGWRRLIRLYLDLVLALLLPITVSRGAGFEVEGVLEAESMAGGRCSSLGKFSFVVRVSGGQYFINIVPDGSEHYYQAAFDGVNHYRYNRDPKGSSSGLASVFSDPVPFQAPHPYIPVLWIAFCQSSYLNQNSKFVMPAYSTGYSRTNLPCEVRRYGDELGLPSEIEYRNDGYSYATDRKKLPPPFDKGFIDAEYLVLTSANVPGIGNVPRRFQLTIFQPKPNVQQKLLTEPLERLLGTVSSVRALQSQSWLPDLAGLGKVPFRDYRFLSQSNTYRQPFDYWTNHWLSKTEARELPGFKEYARLEAASIGLKPYSVIKPVSAGPKSFRNRLILSLVLGIAVLCPLWLVWRKGKQPTTSKLNNYENLL